MSITDAGRFDDRTVQAAPRLVARCRAVDAAAPFSDDLWQAAEAGTTGLALTATAADGALAGLAFTAAQGERQAAELVVDPVYRRRGHGRQLLDELLSRTTGELWIWSHGDHPGGRKLAADHGLERARELLQLRRDVGPDAPDIPDPALPDGVRLRTFVVGEDEGAWLNVNNAAFSWHPEQGAQTLDDILAAETRPDFDPAGFFLAVDEAGEVLGFHWTKLHGVDPAVPGGPPLGEVYVLGVAPHASGRGLGAALTAAGLRHLADVAGVRSVQLYVEGDNAAALTVYERQGFTRFATDVCYVRR